MATWNVRAWGKEVYFTCEADSREEAVDKFLDSDPEHIGFLIEAFPDGTPVEDRTVSLTVDELIPRHLIKNADAAKVLNDMQMEPAGTPEKYKAWKENARWFKENIIDD